MMRPQVTPKSNPTAAQIASIVMSSTDFLDDVTGDHARNTRLAIRATAEAVRAWCEDHCVRCGIIPLDLWQSTVALLLRATATELLRRAEAEAEDLAEIAADIAASDGHYLEYLDWRRDQNDAAP